MDYDYAFLYIQIKIRHNEEILIAWNNDTGISFDRRFKEAIIFRMPAGIDLSIGGNQLASQTDKINQGRNVIRLNFILRLDLWPA